MNNIIKVFFLFFSMCTVFWTGSCTVHAQSQVQGDFYEGLLSLQYPEKTGESAALFEAALSSSNEYIRRAAADELANLQAQGTELSAKTEELIKKEAAGLRSAVYEAVRDASGESGGNKKILELLLGSNHEAVPSDALPFILRECEKQGISFSESEAAVIEGHFAVLRFNYGEALEFFRFFQEDGNWPQSAPQIFLEYPLLINNLGRAFQYTSTGMEGFSLFLQWEDNLKNHDDARHRLLFFAARIARRNGRNAQAVYLFEQSLLLSPNTEQSDACIWYILDLSLNGTSDNFIQQLERLVPIMYNDSYFNDILERFLQILVSKTEWKNVIRVFNLIRESSASIKAAYAWVIFRITEEGFLSREEMSLAAQAANARWTDLSFYLRIAYEAAQNFASSHLYYRLLSADILDLPFIDLQLSSVQEEPSAMSQPSALMQFLLGFFAHNAAEYSMRYILQTEGELSADELRTLASSLEQAGMSAQSIRLVSRYINREGYSMTRRDLELLYPRPFLELTEKFAAQNGIAPEIMFGLIRTESAFQSSVVSRAGAVGLTQLMPDTAQDMAGRIRRAGGFAADNTDYADSHAVLDLSDPSLNLHIGTYYLNYLLQRFDGTLLSLLAYNGGMTRVRRWLTASTLPVDLFMETIPFFETRDYGRKVIAASEVYKELYYSY